MALTAWSAGQAVLIEGEVAPGSVGTGGGSPPGSQTAVSHSLVPVVSLLTYQFTFSTDFETKGSVYIWALFLPPRQVPVFSQGPWGHGRPVG